MTPLITSLEQAGEGSRELAEKLEERRAVLLATADLFDVIGTFMESVAKGTWADYEAAPDTEAAKSPLRQKHREAMRIRDDYKSAARENRNDVALFDAILRATHQEHGSSGLRAEAASKPTHWMPLPPPPSVSTDKGSLRPPFDERDAWGIVNPFGVIWTPITFANEADGWAHLKRFWNNNEKAMQGFKVVPCAVSVRILPQTEKGS